MARASRPAALVTGAANGIGLAIAKHLLNDGWSIAAFDLPRSGLARVLANPHTSFRSQAMSPTPPRSSARSPTL